MRKHPNTVAAFAAGMVASGAMWLAGLFGWQMSQVEAGAVATAVVSVVLFVGRVGVRGVWDRVINGFGDPAA